MKVHEALKNLLENAFDFLDKAIEEVKEKPKYSIINFYTAIELLIKARLMHEHWTLILTKPELGDRAKFTSGDFHSVSLDEASKRLDKIVNDKIHPEELESFQEVRTLRNKMVHFCLPELQSSFESVDEVMKAEFLAMFRLHKVINARWHKIFSKYTDMNIDIDHRMKRHRDYLEGKYNALLPDIERLKGEGHIFFSCPACSFESVCASELAEEDDSSCFSGDCLVCSVSDAITISIACPNCGEDIYCNESEVTCPHCSSKYETDDFIEIIDGGNEYLRAKDGDGPGRAWCSECGGAETVVPCCGGYVCLACFTFFDYEEMEQCEYCSTLCTTRFESSYLTGCLACDGKFGSPEFEKE